MLGTLGLGGADEKSLRADLVTLLGFFFVVLLMENILVIIWAFNAATLTAADTDQTFSMLGIYSAAMLCSGAASFAGGLIGFLFGIPRSVDQVKAPTTAADVQPVAVPESKPSTLRRNTNLENISDGLTKGMLGIGLSQLYRAPDALKAAADALGPAFGPGANGKVVGMAIVFYGAGAGFFFGYLATRTYLTRVFERSDPR